MTGKEALEIVETYNYWKGGADEIGGICINPNYLKAKKSYGEAKSIIEKQDKILSILKNKKVDIKLVLWAGQSVEAYNVEVRERKYFPRAELTQEEFDDIRKWANGKN